MPAFRVTENYILLECKKCGAIVKAMPKQREIMKIRCRNCHGVRFRRVIE